MNFFRNSVKFGWATLVSPLDQWVQEEYISLYIIRQPIGDFSSFIEFLRDEGADLWKRVQESPKTYFVCIFQKMNGKYDFFNKAKVKTI